MSSSGAIQIGHWINVLKSEVDMCTFMKINPSNRDVFNETGNFEEIHHIDPFFVSKKFYFSSWPFHNDEYQQAVHVSMKYDMSAFHWYVHQVVVLKIAPEL